MAIGALIATITADSASTRNTSADASVPCIKPRDASARCVIGLCRTMACSQGGIVFKSTKMLLANVNGIKNKKLVVITDSGVFTFMPKMIQTHESENEIGRASCRE